MHYPGMELTSIDINEEKSLSIFDDELISSPSSPSPSSSSSTPQHQQQDNLFPSSSSSSPSTTTTTFYSCLCSPINFFLSSNSKFKLLNFLDFLINDIIVVIFSLVDIILDLLVCQQFYITGRMTFFYISIVIFLIAQLSYSFLFVATWGKTLSPGYKILTFLLILPFGQFVPFFTWIESFHFNKLDEFIKWIGLIPTSESEETINNQHHNTTTTTTTDGNNDMLWDYIQHKYQSHAGFVAEALAEAIPQCILQTIALITQSSSSSSSSSSGGDGGDGDDGISPIIVLSILMSICVISSKGYLISYSIHRPTFIFNFICIIADCFNLFATCSWLFQQNNILDISYHHHQDHHHDLIYIDSSIINQLWIYFFLIGCFFLVIGGFGLTAFSMIDDHLKLSFPTLWIIGSNENSPWFHFYLVRIIAWFLAIIPVCVVFLTTKLTLIPILVFNSLDPEHALHWNFYITLYNFLQLHLKDSRIKATNCFILECRQDIDRLKSYLQRYSVQREDNGVLRDRESRKRREEEVLIEWLQGVGKQHHTRTSISRPRPSTTTNIPSQTEEDLMLQQALLESILQLDEASARQTIRQSALQNSISNIWKRTRRDLALRSALFYRLEISQNPSFRQPIQGTEQANERQELINRIYQYPFMFYSGMFFMIIGLVNGLLFIPAFFLFIIYGSLYPIIHLITTLSSSSFSSSSPESHLLSIILTSTYIFLLILLCLLIPAVSQFQLFRTDIVDLKEFPIEFYHPVVVKEIHRRFNAELDRKAFEDLLETRLGQDMLRYIRDYVEDYQKIWK